MFRLKLQFFVGCCLIVRHKMVQCFCHPLRRISTRPRVHRFAVHQYASFIPLSPPLVFNVNLESILSSILPLYVCSTLLFYRLTTCLRRSVAPINLVLVWLVCDVTTAKAKRAAKAPTRKGKGARVDPEGDGGPREGKTKGN